MAKGIFPLLLLLKGKKQEEDGMPRENGHSIGSAHDKAAMALLKTKGGSKVWSGTVSGWLGGQDGRRGKALLLFVAWQVMLVHGDLQLEA